MTDFAPVSHRRVHVIQGEYRVSDDPDVMLTTLLGSCVSACLRDPRAGVGGMNHFLLPGDGRAGADGARFGAYAMELLINDLLGRGADRRRLEGKLFGGARMLCGSFDVGAANAAFAEDYLRREGIPMVGGSLRGSGARRVQFWPVDGRARQLAPGMDSSPIFNAERRAPVRLADIPFGGVELF